MNPYLLPLPTAQYPQPKLSTPKVTIDQTDLESALQIAGISVFTVDLISRRLKFSIQQPQVCNLPVNQPISISSALSLVMEEHQTNLINLFRNAAQNKKDLIYEFELKSSGTVPKWLQISGSYKSGCSENSGYFLCLLSDVSITKRNEIRKNELLAMLNHDLRTPLTTIKLYMQMFSKLALKCEHFNTADLLGIASKQVDAMTKMMEDFLETTLLESGKIKINKTTFEINSLIASELNTGYAAGAKYELQMNCPDKIWLDADRDKITQVLHNYISNALKYSPEGTTISISSRKMQDQMIVSVKDYGIGISPADQKKLFSKFFRSETDPVQKTKGYGIGLYLVNDIVERHGGKVWATSNLGAGSTFYFSLPL